MTQIIGAVAKWHTFHVSDRLLTRSHGSQVTSFEDNSNKTVVFRSTDGHVVLGYTGRAYLDGIPTDSFIAQSLTGVDLANLRTFTGIGFPPSWTDLGRSIERLRVDCAAAVARLSPAERDEAPLSISILGWRQRRSRNRIVTPVVWELQQSPRSRGNQFELQRDRRWWAWDRGFTVSGVPGISAETLKYIRLNLRERGHHSPGEMKRVLIEGIRLCTQARPETVGRDCLSVILRPFGATPQTLIDYVRDTVEPGPSIRPTTEDAFTPWIIAPPWAYAPAKITGGGIGWTDTGTGYSWKTEGFEEQVVPRRIEHVTHVRKPDPQARSR